MADAMSDYLAQKVLDHVFKVAAYTAPSALYLRLSTAAPNSNGSDFFSDEVSGGSYAAQDVTAAFAAATGTGVTATDADVTFAGMPACTVTHAMVCSSALGSDVEDFLWSLELVDEFGDPAPVAVSAGASLAFPSGTLRVTNPG